MKLLSVDTVLAVFRFMVKLLQRIEARDMKDAVNIDKQISEMRQKQVQLEASSLKASRVAINISNLIK